MPPPSSVFPYTTLFRSGRHQPAGAVEQPPGGCELGVFAALADPTRRRVLEVLVEAGWASATALAGRLPVSRQAVVKHLHVRSEEHTSELQSREKLVCRL